MGGSKTGDEALAEIVLLLGQETVDRAVGTWLAKSHRERPRLFWSKPEAPARAGHYLAFVRQLPCAICGAPEPSDPHHVGKHSTGKKTDDYRCVPLCRRCHDQVHSGIAIQDLNPRVIATLVRYLRIVEQT